MTQQQAEHYSPMKDKCFGVTHDAETGQEIIRCTRELKCGIGIPSGPAIHVWLQHVPGKEGLRWHLQKGYGKDAKTAMFKERAKAEAAYAENFPSAPVCPYPRRLSYFTFSRPELVEGKLQYKPDFDAIEAHGECPSKIDILITDLYPLSAGYAMYTRSERLCSGDGINASRVLKMAATPDEKASAEACQSAGEKYFPIINRCRTFGCSYFGKDCKFDGEFRFQVIGALRIGGCAFLHTTSARSGSQLYSGLVNVFKVFKRLEGVPLKLELQSWRAAPPGEKPSVQYAYKINFDAPTVEIARQKVLDAAYYFNAALEGPEAPVALIEAPRADADGEGDDEPTHGDAASIAAEFYPEAEAEQPETATPDPPIPVAAATQATTDGLAEKLAASAAKARKPRTPAAAAPGPVAVAAPGPVAVPDAVPEPIPAQMTGEDLF